MNTEKRQAQIATLIGTRRFHGQDGLLRSLCDKGLKVTQATLSRDLKRIGAHKQNGCYKIGPIGYALNEFSQVTSMQHVEPNMIVIKTTPGLAQSAALLLDQSFVEGVAGTVAGDDTIFVCINPGKSHSKILRKISEIFQFRRRS